MNFYKFNELLSEVRLVLSGPSHLIDSILPPILFVIINAFLGFNYAMWGSLVVALAMTAHRWYKGQSSFYALGGMAAVAFAIALALLFDRAEAYFLPGIITDGLTVLVAIISTLAGKPMVAWTSYLTRRWPWEWYWHPQVRPAYSEVTWLWALYFALRAGLQIALFQLEATDLLVLVNLISGWPTTVGLLVVSYFYGTWRLRHLGGPSVEEFREGVKPPWKGQLRGF